MKTLPTLIGLASVFAVLTTAPGFAQFGGGRMMVDRFASIDENQDGQIVRAEARDWRKVVFATMDANDDQRLTREEYLAVQLGRGADPAARGPRFGEQQAAKNQFFTELDSDRDGYVSRQLFLDEGESLFDAADADKNGAVTMPEFMKARWM